MFHNINLRICEILLSLPSRERGLKFGDTHSQRKADGVAPFAGAWIEIVHLYGWSPDHPVSPFAGAWIEIIGHLSIFRAKMSLPSRERGLK